MHKYVAILEMIITVRLNRIIFIFYEMNILDEKGKINLSDIRLMNIFMI
jgi:hypothetical protein